MISIVVVDEADRLPEDGNICRGAEASRSRSTSPAQHLAGQRPQPRRINLPSLHALTEPCRYLARVPPIAGPGPDVIRSPRRDWDNRRGKVLTALLVAGPTLYSAGVFIPLGAVAWFAWWRNAGGLGHLPKQRRSGPPTTTRPSSGAEVTSHSTAPDRRVSGCLLVGALLAQRWWAVARFVLATRCWGGGSLANR